MDADAVARLLEASPVFGRLGPEARSLLHAELELRLFRRGEVLIHQGEQADGLYLVASGRLQVLLTSDPPTVLGEVTRGEVTGEMALITDQPRSATVRALRDTHVLFLATDAFDRVVQAHPQAFRLVSTALIAKLVETIRHGTPATPATNLVLVPLDPTGSVRALGRRLATALERLVGPVPVIGADDVRAALGEAPSDLERAVWREQLENSHRAVLYVADPTFGPWTDECVQQADLVLLAGSGSGAGELRPVERELRSRQGSVPTRTELILLHESGCRGPRGTRRWLAPRDVDRHHHVRVDRPGDYDRVARLLLGQAIGVVFSGGGARGIAHIGVLRALRDRGVPIDATAGASIGAIVAAAVARGDGPEELAAMLHAAVVERSPIDLTFPSIAVARGERVTDHIRRGADGMDLEDLWRSCLCVSTNLTRGTLQVHTRGPAWMAIRSSFSVPGLFPPMVNDAGELLVDGGILDNLPIAPLRAAHAGITIVGIDVGAHRELATSSVPSTGVISGWKVLAAGLRRRALDDVTSLPRLLMRLTELGTLGDEDRGDCRIRPDLDAVSLLAFDRFDDLVELGERAAGPAIDSWLASPHAPALPTTP